jgi:hypothetical protein
MRRLVLIGVCAAALSTAACTPTDTGGGPGATSGTTTTAPTAAATTGGTGATNATVAADQGTWRVRYDWAAPTKRVSVANRQIIPLPYLAEIHVGNHSTENPGYGRISFYFRGGMPSYNLNYAREVLSEGRGEPIALEGNAFLRIQFSDARQHNDAGKTTLTVKPDARIGYPNLVSYGFGGDFEGYVTYGLGIQVAANSDQVLPVRVGELTKKPDGKGGYFYVVAFDIRTG